MTCSTREIAFGAYVGMTLWSVCVGVAVIGWFFWPLWWPQVRAWWNTWSPM